MAFPGCGLLSTPAATVVAVHGSAGLVPMLIAGLSHVPVVAVISGWRIADFAGAFLGAPFLSCAESATAAAITIVTVNSFNFMCTLRSLKRVSYTPDGPLGPPGTVAI